MSLDPWPAMGKPSLLVALEEGRAGMELAYDHAIAVEPDWGRAALAFVRSYAEKHPSFCGWMVVKASELDPKFPNPVTPKAWGQPIKLAAQQGWIARAGYGRDPNRHGNPVPLWRSNICGEGT